MSSHGGRNRSSRVGLFAVVAVALLAIVMACAMFLPGDSGGRREKKAWNNDDNPKDPRRDLRDRVERRLGEVM